MLEYILLMAVGVSLLWGGSTYFVEAAAEVARRRGVSELVIGLTLVSLTTTLPELLASTTASHLGSSGVAVGNAVGSDITNIALILGLCMTVREYTTEKVMVKRYGLFLLMVCLLYCGIVWGGISRVDGGILLAGFFVYIWFTWFTARKEPVSSETAPSLLYGCPAWKIALAFAGGIGAIFAGAQCLVHSSLSLSREVGILESAIGSTVVALGTSLPEFSVSLRAVMGRHGQISLGNIIGANTVNLLSVTGASALINPLTLDRNLLYFNTPLMVVVTVLLLAFMQTGYTLRRWEGVVFLFIYGFFVVQNVV